MERRDRVGFSWFSPRWVSVGFAGILVLVFALYAARNRERPRYDTQESDAADPEPTVATGPSKLPVGSLPGSGPVVGGAVEDPADDFVEEEGADEAWAEYDEVFFASATGRLAEADGLLESLKAGAAVATEETAKYVVLEAAGEPPRMVVQVLELVDELRTESPDRMAQTGRDLLQYAAEPSLRVLGAVLTVAGGEELTPAEVNLLVGDSQPQVPLQTLAALECLGYWSASREINRLFQSAVEGQDLWQWVQDSSLPVDARRQALLLLDPQETPLALDMLRGLAADADHDWSIRAMALGHLEHVAPSELVPLRDRAAKAGEGEWLNLVEDAMAWHDLAAETAPEDLHTREINRILDKEHGQVLLSLGTLLRARLKDRPEAMHPETRVYLYETLDGFRNRPLDDDEAYWLRVLEGLCKQDGKAPEPSARLDRLFRPRS